MKNERHEFTAQSLEPAGRPGPWRNLGLMAAGLALAFCVPLYELARFAAASELYSYILLVPFVSVYLVWLKWKALPPFSGPARMPAAALGAAAAALLAAYALIRHSAFRLTEDDDLAMTVAAFLLLFAAGCWWFLGKDIVRALAFPLGFLVFMVPIPGIVLDGIIFWLQVGSAWAAHLFFILAGTTFFRDGLVFQLPGFSMQVAPECSGIHSSLVLFITSSVAGYLFLRSPWRRTILVLAVIPLALLRNGFRVFVIGELCTHVGPEMIDSPIHRHGGPVFFALSLIPLFLLLYFLRKSERSNKNSKPQ